MSGRRRALTWVVLVACGDSPAAPNAAADETAGSSGSWLPPVNTTTSVDTSSSSSGDASSSSSSSGENSNGFVQDPDTSPFVGCSIWENDCPRGHKCVRSGASTTCVPVADDPASVGEPCTVPDPTSGRDTCDATSMCHFVDSRLEGVCVEICSGSENNPICTGICDQCHINGAGDLALCLPTCDPIAQDCEDGSGCYATSDRTACAPAGRVGLGDACVFVNQCAAGLQCVAADALPECGGSSCCAPFCSARDSDACTDLAGTVCVPLFDSPETGCAPIDLGVCMNPP